MTARTIYKTEKSFNGPWLLSRESLFDLDHLFDQWLERWRESDTREREESSSNRAPSKSVTLNFGDHKKIVASSISEAAQQRDVLSDVATSLDITLMSYRSYLPTASVKIQNSKVEVSVDQDAPGDSQAVFVALHQWATSNTASPIQRFWLWAHPVLMIVLGAAFILCLLFAAPSSNSTLKEEGRALVAKGVTQNNRDEAVRILLALQSNYLDEPTTAWQARYLVICGVIFVLGALLAVPPRIVIGVGAGETRLRRWRMWLTFLFVFVPASILLPFVISFLAGRL